MPPIDICLVIDDVVGPAARVRHLDDAAFLPPPPPPPPMTAAFWTDTNNDDAIRNRPRIVKARTLTNERLVFCVRRAIWPGHVCRGFLFHLKAVLEVVDR